MINKEDVLFLWPDSNDSWCNEMKKNGVAVSSIYRNCNLFNRFIRRLKSRFNLSTKRFFDTWIDNINKYKMIIINADKNNSSVPHVLRKKGFKGRIIYWYWNPVKNCVPVNRVNRNEAEIWTFDIKDSQKYKIFFNDAFYLDSICNTYVQDNITNKQALFIGLDKNRLSTLLALKKKLNDIGYNIKLIVVKDKTSKNKKFCYSNRITYTEAIKLIGNSEIIVDIVQSDQSGLTLRSLESIFMHKKIITNNKAIIESKAYNSNNVFIYGKDFDLKSFVEKKYIDIPEETLAYYSFSNWLNRLGVK